MVSPRQTRSSEPLHEELNSILTFPKPTERKATSSTPAKNGTNPNSESHDALPAQLVEELAQILADILVEDFQADRRATVGSLSRSNRTFQ